MAAWQTLCTCIDYMSVPRSNYQLLKRPDEHKLGNAYVCVLGSWEAAEVGEGWVGYTHGSYLPLLGDGAVAPTTTLLPSRAVGRTLRCIYR